MGNNPIGMIDPDGGFAEGPGPGWWSRLWGRITGTTASEYQDIPNDNNIAYSINLSDVVVTGSNPHHINNGANPHWRSFVRNSGARLHRVPT